MKLMTRILIAVCLFGLAAPSAFAQQENEFKMKIATVAPKRTPWGDLLRRYKKKVRKHSNKRIKVKLFLDGRKGNEQSIVRQVFKGTVQFGGVSVGAMATLVKDIDILELPYLFDSYAEADRVLDAVRPIINEMLKTKGFRLVMLSENGFRSFGTKDGFIKKPSDLKAVKMRSQESEVHLATYRALGAEPVAISVGEVMSSLQTGVVSGFDNTPLFTQAVSWHQAIKYYTLTEHIYQPALLFVNSDWYDKLPPEVQKAVDSPELYAGLEKKGRKAVRSLNGPLLKNFEKPSVGVKVYKLTAAEKQVFKDATRGVWKKRVGKAGPLGKKLFKAIMAAKKGG